MSKREGGIAVDFNMPLREKYYMIPAGVCKEVKFIMNGDHGYIGTNLAANFPGDYNIPLVKEGISKIREGMEGIWDIDRRFFENSGEIIVDNRSEQFQLIDSGERKRLPFLTKERKSTFKASLEKKEWTEMFTAESYGIPVRSAFGKVLSLIHI